MEYYYFRDLDFYCIKRSTVKYVRSLRQIKRRTEYHQNQLEKCLQDPLLEQLGQDFVDGLEGAALSLATHVTQLDPIIDAESAALLQSLRSQFDIFAQIVNSELIPEPLNNRRPQVSFKLISNLINFQNIEAEINAIQIHENFAFIDDVVNLSKHVIALSPKYMDSFDLSKRELGSYKIFDGYLGTYKTYNKDLGVLPQKELNWIIDTLMQWVNEKISSLLTEIKNIQDNKIDESCKLIYV
ncbi:hypothetical protein [Priestia megaterium]|uniref:hypothetical protein n=1 Tax=Priestia megaterium TaxID=1404 RepID=UPI0027310B5B|nr:hypothetical protein [Priestia megaterium]MDP1442604.1 hypothetical protein [Priestia megaterium]MDP1471559.1 hypothetical protein [Priestia megaterium]MDR0132172.1 hypothetical protein [Priestia megaterium]MDR4221799.1 hypothetical protein [Priestia megaterium]